MMPWYLGNSRVEMGNWWGAGFGILAAWSMVWTGLSLWHAAKRGEKGWFIFFLLVHTAGIMEFVYLMFVAKAFGAPAKSSSRRKK